MPTNINKKNETPNPLWAIAYGIPMTPEPRIEFTKLKLVPNRLEFWNRSAGFILHLHVENNLSNLLLFVEVTKSS
jgi:hypothetical protein